VATGRQLPKHSRPVHKYNITAYVTSGLASVFISTTRSSHPNLIRARELSLIFLWQ